MMFWSWFSSISLSELLWLLISLQEQLSLLLFIISEKLWIEICWVEGSGIISPLGNVSVIEWSLNLLIMMLFFPLLKLLWHWWISGSLELFDLISIESSIIKNLPLLWLSLRNLVLLAEAEAIGQPLPESERAKFYQLIDQVAKKNILLKKIEAHYIQK